MLEKLIGQRQLLCSIPIISSFQQVIFVVVKELRFIVDKDTTNLDMWNLRAKTTLSRDTLNKCIQFNYFRCIQYLPVTNCKKYNSFTKCEYPYHLGLNTTTNQLNMGYKQFTTKEVRSNQPRPSQKRLPQFILMLRANITVQSPTRRDKHSHNPL